MRIEGQRKGSLFQLDDYSVVHRPTSTPPDLEARRRVPIGQALRARHQLRATLHHFFRDRGFLEVSTPALCQSPGTDPHIEPISANFMESHGDAQHHRAYLHTSPELAMKRLLSAGSGPIYQLAPVWRNGEVTTTHNPEFSMLEWYRPWEPLDSIIEDIQDLVTLVLDEQSARPLSPPFPVVTMAEAVEASCGFDLSEALDTPSLQAAIRRHGLLSERAIKAAPWDELFYSLTISHIDPWISDQGPLFITRWPIQLAVLARPCPDDPRFAQRVELYVDGIELANGFHELTDPDEQRHRFHQDNQYRKRHDLPQLPIPSAFLHALEYGMPPSSGIALGLDRLLLLATPNAETLRDVAPFSWRRTDQGIQWP